MGDVTLNELLDQQGQRAAAMDGQHTQPMQAVTSPPSVPGSTRPRSEAEWGAHQAFYSLTVHQRDYAWEESRRRLVLLDDLITAFDQVWRMLPRAVDERDGEERARLDERVRALRAAIDTEHRLTDRFYAR